MIRTIKFISNSNSRYITYKDMMNVPITIIDKANKIYLDHLMDIYNKFPEDDWFSLSEDYDLNLFTDEDENGVIHFHETVYKVVNGDIITDQYLKLQ